MHFYVVARSSSLPSQGTSIVYLRTDNWNDYGFVTLFHVSLLDENGEYHELGSVKIGFQGQTIEVDTKDKLGSRFESLPKGFFSVGTDVEYYKNIKKMLSDDFSAKLLKLLNDVTTDDDLLNSVIEEEVFKTSLMRYTSISVIYGQYRRVLSGNEPLTDFNFYFEREHEAYFAGYCINFSVVANSSPLSNIHAIIGRNGSGKTTMLNDMIDAFVAKPGRKGKFYEKRGVFNNYVPIDHDYFGNMISVSFSAFDPFIPPQDHNEPNGGICYYYIGLKDRMDAEGVKLKSLPVLHEEFYDNLARCMSEPVKRDRWLRQISVLESDDNFAMNKLCALAEVSKELLKEEAIRVIGGMSSGHTIVLLTITKLVATVVEKTLVLVDEPESHLHPPLLSAFTRALSELLFERNGVAIIATHSPVVLQEVPQSCVWKITRLGLAVSMSRPEIQTFGENVGVLTREVFGLEVVRSGFHTLLFDAVKAGGSYDEIVLRFDGQLGLEAKAILRSMIYERDTSGEMP